jgi:hypothetical protein
MESIELVRTRKMTLVTQPLSLHLHNSEPARPPLLPHLPTLQVSLHALQVVFSNSNSLCDGRQCVAARREINFAGSSASGMYPPQPYLDILSCTLSNPTLSSSHVSDLVILSCILPYSPPCPSHLEQDPHSLHSPNGISEHFWHFHWLLQCHQPHPPTLPCHPPI